MKKIVAVLIVMLIVSSVLYAGGQREQPKSGFSIVRYLNQETDPKVVAIQREWVEGFRKQYPNYDVILEGAPNTVINQTIATYVQAGAPLDVIHADGGSAARLAASNLLVPLDDVIQALGGRDKFSRGVLLIYNDKVLSINQAPATPVLHYRKDVFEKHGLKPPSNWQELLEAAKKIHSSEIAGIALPGGENRATSIYSGIFMWGNQANYFDKDLKVTVDTPRNREAMAFYAELLKYAPPDAAGWGFTEPLESFMAGRAAMLFYWHGMDLIRASNPSLVPKVGLAQFPKGRIQVTEQGGRYVSLFGRTQNKEASKAWIQYIFTPENAIKLNEYMPMLYPPVTDRAKELARKSTAPAFKQYGDLLFNVVYPSSAFAYNQIFHAGGISEQHDRPMDTWKLNPLVSVIWNSNLYARAIQRIAYQGWTVEKAAAELQKQLEEQVVVAKKEMGL